MARYNSKNIRNIAFLGHQSSGKTSLVESLYFVTGGTTSKGEVEKKTTVSDYLPDEQKKLSSIQTAVVPVYYNNYKINLLDLPGSDDFIGETIGALSAVKGAILVIDGSVGVQVGTVKSFNTLRRKGVPTFILVNKMDKDGVDFEKVLDEIKEKLGKNVIPFGYPLGHGSSFDGFVNTVEMSAVKDDGTSSKAEQVFGDKLAKAQELHDAIIEAVAGEEDELLEKYFGGEELTQEEINRGLRTGVLKGDLIPVLVGSATKNVGMHTLLDMIINYMPSPADLKPLECVDEAGKPVVRETKEEEPFSAFVFKTIVDPYAGVISLLKINSGVLKVGDDVNVNDSTQRVGTLYVMTGKNLAPVQELCAGDIGAVTRFENAATGMTFSSPKNIVTYNTVKFPSAVIFKAIEIKNKNDEAKIGGALAKIQLEDPTVEVKRNSETKQLLVGGVSDSHVDYIIDKIQGLYKIAVDVVPMKVVYRESIKKVGQAEGRHVKQSGGSGQYGVVVMRFEPAEENCFAEEVFGGSVPKNFFPAVEKGFFEAVKSGPKAGFPVIGVKAVLMDGKYHPVDSNEAAFKMAAILAFKNAYDKCDPIILEPIMRIRVNVEQRFVGDVMSDLNTRRARIQNILEGEHGNQEIEALVPEAEILDYATNLKSITQSSGYFSREFESYEQVPSFLVDKVVRENKITNN